MKIRHQVLLFLITAFLFIAFIGVAGVLSGHRFVLNQDRMAYAYSQLLALEKIRGGMDRQMREVLDLTILGETDTQAYEECVADVRSAFDELQSINHLEIAEVVPDEEDAERKEREVIRWLRMRHSQLTRRTDRVVALVSAGKHDDARQLLSNRFFTVSDHGLGPAIDSQIQDEWSEIEAARDRARGFGLAAERISIALAAIAVVVISALAVAVHRRVSRPIEALADNVKRIGAGDLTTAIEVRSKDEIGTLARNVAKMAKDLQSRIAVEKELSAAMARNSALRESVRELEKTSQNKDDLMRELNHRIKNNLSIISSLVSMKESSFSGSVDLSDLRSRVQSISMVHEKLAQSRETGKVRLRFYLIDLVEALFESLCRRRVKVDARIDDLSVPGKIAVTLGLIVNEIATNTVKYGMPADGEPEFRMELSPISRTSNVELVLSNTGPPIPESVDFDNPTTSGLCIVSALVAQLDGSLEVTRSPHPRFHFTLDPYKGAR